jgi:hypothetical protein
MILSVVQARLPTEAIRLAVSLAVRVHLAPSARTVTHAGNASWEKRLGPFLLHERDRWGTITTTYPVNVRGIVFLVNLHSPGQSSG